MKSKKKKPAWINYALLAAAVFTGTFLLYLLPPVQDLEKKIRDQYFMIRGPLDISNSPVVIVEVSQEADEEIPFRYPWPRHVYARLINNLNEAGAKVIAVDILFDQESEIPQNDSLFAAAIADHDNVVLIGGFRRDAPTSGGGVYAERTTRVMPAPLLEKAMNNPPGIVDMRRDPDGFIREYPIGARFAGDTLYSLAIQSFLTDRQYSIREAGKSVQINGHTIPKNREGFMYINYHGPNRTFPHIGFEKVIDDEDFDTRMEMMAFPVNEFSDPDYGILASGILKDKIVLVGATMPELQDYHPVPFATPGGESTMSGVEIHANALQTILDNRYFRDVSPAALWAVLFIVLLLMARALHTLNVYPGAIVTTLFVAASAAAGYGLFSGPGMIIQVIPFMIGGAGMFVTITTRNYLSEQKEKQRITSMFSSYVSPDLVTRLIAGDEKFTLSGENKNLTVLFSDIANFSRFSEKMPPEKLVAFMNEYLGEMTSIINEQNGTLDKYIGDAVMAFFGAPISVKNHALQACRSALLMQKASEKIYSAGEFSGIDIPFYTRIGINTGPMVVGNMGSSRRFNYTVMGDNVNLAARCEAACKEFGVPVMVTGPTKNAAGSNEILFRSLGRLRVIGKQEAVDIYQPILFKAEVTPELETWTQEFETGLQLYLNREWQKAADIFEKTEQKELVINAIQLGVNPSRLYMELCRKWMEQPPPANWKGVIEQSKK